MIYAVFPSNIQVWFQPSGFLDLTPFQFAAIKRRGILNLSAIETVTGWFEIVLPHNRADSHTGRAPRVQTRLLPPAPSFCRGAGPCDVLIEL